MIDLDGMGARPFGERMSAATGIETTAVGTSSAYFDVDGDLFAERTGWLKGDDGFLVLDANGNARIDGIDEMFGNRFQGGYAELASYDTNGDGKISVGDLIWSELQVWQDRDRDGVTDGVRARTSGECPRGVAELKSLSALGIIEISLTNTALNDVRAQSSGGRLSGVVTPQGLRRRHAAVANDNQMSAWRGATFRLCG